MYNAEAPRLLTNDEKKIFAKIVNRPITQRYKSQRTNKNGARWKGYYLYNCTSRRGTPDIPPFSLFFVSLWYIGPWIRDVLSHLLALWIRNCVSLMSCSPGSCQFKLDGKLGWIAAARGLMIFALFLKLRGFSMNFLLWFVSGEIWVVWAENCSYIFDVTGTMLSPYVRPKLDGNVYLMFKVCL